MIHAVSWSGRNKYSRMFARYSLANKLGGMSYARINGKLSELSGNTYHTAPYTSMRDVYPGEGGCRRLYPHPKWHVLASSLILDIFHMVDELFGILQR